MSLPLNTDYVTATVSTPSTAISNCILVVDLSDISSTYFWNKVDTTDATKGRAAKNDGTELPTHWVGFDGVANDGFVRVLWTGSLPVSSTITLRIYPPNSGNSSYVDTATYGSQAVYGSTIASYDFSQDPAGSSPQLIDLTGGGNDGTTEGSMVSGNLENGPFGVSQWQFDETDDAVTIPDNTSFHLYNDWILCGWVKSDDLTGNGYQSVISYGAETGTDSIQIQLAESGAETPVIYLGVNNTWKTSSSISTNTWYFIAAIANPQDPGPDIDLWVNNVNESPTPISNITQIVPNTDFFFGARSDRNSSAYLGGKLGPWFLIQGLGALSTSEALMGYMYDNQNDPTTFWGTWTWQGSTQIIITLTAETGTFTTAGQNLGLGERIKINAEPGFYITSEEKVTFNKVELLVAEPGFFITSEGSAVFRPVEVLFSNSGNYETIWNAPALHKTMRFIGEHGTFSTSGKDVNLIKKLNVLLQQGVFSTAWQDLKLERTLTFITHSGSFSTTGNPVGTFRRINIKANQGNYATIGQNVGLNKIFNLITTSGSFSTTGNPIYLKEYLRMPMGTGHFNVTGFSLFFPNLRFILTMGTGNFNATGHPIIFRQSLSMPMEVGNFNFDEQDIKLIQKLGAPLDAGSFSITGKDVGLHRNLEIFANQGLFITNPNDVRLLKKLRFPMEQGTFMTSRQDVGVNRIITVQVEHGNYTYSGYSASLGLNIMVDAETGEFITTFNIPILYDGILKGLILDSPITLILTLNSKLNG